MSNEPVVKLTKTVYVFDEATRKFLEAFEAQPCQVEAGVFLEPVCSVEFAPPTLAANQAAILSADKTAWNIVPDFKDIIVWNDAGDSIAITEIGVAPPVGYTVNKSQALLDKEAMDTAKTDQFRYIDEQYLAGMQANISYMAHVFQADAVSQDMITKSLSSMNGIAPADFGWYDIANVKVAMTAMDLQGLSNAIFVRAQPMFDYRQMCKELVRLANTPLQVSEVVWQYQPV
jgi:hypothetical protein